MPIVGGGGSGWRAARNVGQCSLSITNVAAAPAVVLAFSQGDATFINIAAPTSPKPVAAGVYAYTLVIAQDGGGDGGAFNVKLTVDDDWYSINAEAGVNTTQAASGVQATISVTWYSDAASPFHVAISDITADTYSGTLYVQRLA